MGTRAAFFFGDPTEATAELIGCIAWDGYPDGAWANLIRGATNEEEFRTKCAQLAQQCDHWTPASDGFPFPWIDDLFLTDYTYAFFNDQVRVTCFYSGFRPLDEVGDDFEWPEKDELPHNQAVPALPSEPGKGHDSIIIIGLID